MSNRQHSTSSYMCSLVEKDNAVAMCSRHHFVYEELVVALVCLM